MFCVIKYGSASKSLNLGYNKKICDICYKSNIQPYSQTVAIFICNLQYRHLCYLPLVGIGKFEDQLTLLGPKSKTRFLFQIRSEAIGKIEKDDTGRHYDKENNRTGYSMAYKDKEVMFDKSWNRKGYKK